MASNTFKITIDLSDFNKLTKIAPKIMNEITKDTFEKTSAKVRKEFIKEMLISKYYPLEKTPKYKPRYIRPLEFLSKLIRFRVLSGRKQVNAVIGLFTGKAGKTRITNAS